MGSLPNLRSLSNDPNTVYNYELCDPENDATSTEGKSRKRLLTCLPRTGGNFESLSEVHNIRNVNLNFAGDAAAPGRIQFHHRRIRHTRSSGSQYNYQMQNANLNWDDYLLQPQLSAYSPISSRSSRSNVTWSANNALYNFGPGSNSRNHRDSLTSSGGASSVRRLIAVVRSTPSRLGPVYSRKVLCRNFAALCLGHVTVTAALLPLISLQSSVSTWWWPNDSITQSSDVGSFLLCGSFAVASIFTLLSPIIIHLLGCNWTPFFWVIAGYVCTSAFFVAHLYPTIRCLILAYVLLGVCLGPVTCARVSYIVTLANKLTYVMTEEEEMYEQINGEAKESILQKLSRGLQASQDLGMVLGNIVAWCFLYYSRNIEQERTVLKTLFNEDESGDWVCGSQSSPYFERTITTSEILGNSTWYEEIVVSCRATAMLASVFVGCGVVAVALTAAFTDKIRLFLYQDPLERPHGVEVYHAVKNAFKDPILQLAAPMSVFIGLHQGFIHADFSKWYVACSLGIPNISLVFLSMGLLQSVAAFTLSLLLQNVPRYLVIDLLLHIYPDSTWQVAFVHGNFFKFLGLSVALGLHGVLSTRVKLYALAFFMILGIAPHTWLEMKLAAKRKMKSALSTL
ncbi:hypothetical protein RUM43_010180 [Polyplax serrata]|uniref:Uncharacterized protein n=1 Tax=Polyplax serrata TaxID=468196 RepID=A0AAN8P3V2_POLSC